MLPNCYSKLHQHLQLSMHTLLQKDLSIKRRLASMYESVLRSVRCKLMKFRLKKLSFNYNRNWHTLLIHLTGCFKFIAILWLKTCVHTGHVQIESTCISVGFFFLHFTLLPLVLLNNRLTDFQFKNRYLNIQTFRIDKKRQNIYMLMVTCHVALGIYFSGFLEYVSMYM